MHRLAHGTLFPERLFSNCDGRAMWRGAAVAIVLASALVAQNGCVQDSTQPPDNQTTCTAQSCTDAPGTICTWAGNGDYGFNGDGKPILESSFYWPIDLVYANGVYYVLDWNNHAVRKVMPDGTFQTVFGSGFVGDGSLDANDASIELTPPGYPATQCNLNHPTQLLPLSDGTFLLTCWHNHKLRHFDPTTGLEYVTCGSAPGFAGDGGPAKDALLNQPTQTVLGPDDAYYVLDMRNQRIRRIDTNDIITTVVGTGVRGYAGDGGPPLQAELNFPYGPNPQPGGALTFDEQGILYISDSLNNRIRRVDFGQNVITTYAGTGTAGAAGDGGLATAAQLSNPRDLLIHDGKMYVADQLNNRVRVIDMATGVISTFAGNGTAAFCGDGGLATEASLNQPTGLEYAEGYIYIADYLNSRVRRVKL